jgi:hypothetical protein
MTMTRLRHPARTSGALRIGGVAVGTVSSGAAAGSDSSSRNATRRAIAADDTNGVVDASATVATAGKLEFKWPTNSRRWIRHKARDSRFG